MPDQSQEAQPEPQRNSDRLDEVRRWGERMEKWAQQAESQLAEIGPLRRQAALWKAGVRYDAGAKLLLQQLPDDVDLNDPQAVREACSTIVAAVLGARDQLVSP